MKNRIRKYYKFEKPYYNIEFCVDGHWLSVCSTVDDNKPLAYKLKESCLKFVENGGSMWWEVCPKCNENDKELRGNTKNT